MEEPTGSFQQLAMTWKNFARRLLLIGENRFELLTVEVQEEMECLLRVLLLAAGAAAFGLLAAITLTAAIVVLCWPYSPLAALFALAALYGVAGIILCRRLAVLLRDRQVLPASRDQFKKDHVCLKKLLE